MGTSGLAAPPTAPRARPLPPPPPPSRPRAGPRRPPSYGRILAWSLVASLAAHLLLLFVSPLFIRVGVPSLPVGIATDVPAAPDGVRLINPVVRADAPAEPVLDNVAPRPTADIPSPRTPAPRGVTEPGAERAPARVGEVLRPGYRDARLVVPPREPIEEELSDIERYRRHLAARIQARADSMGVDAPNTDWTVRDGDGNRWGLSEKGIHLGPLTIPRQIIPIPNTGDTRKREEEAEKQRQHEAIKRQEEDRSIREEQDRAIRETRERRDAERRAKRDGGDG